MTDRGRVGRAGSALATLGVAALALAGCAAVERTGTLATPIPPAAPRAEIAAQADHAALVRAFGGEARAPMAGAFLDDLAGRLVAKSGRPDLPADVTILDTPAVNAFALPSGRLYVTRGLLALVTDTSEIAAVLAHELGHVVRRHAALRGELEARATLVSKVETDVLGDADAASRSRRTSRATLAGFSREQEYEADEMSVAILAGAGLDPNGAVRALAALGRNAELARRAGDADDAAERLSSHPETASRLGRVREAVRRLGITAPRERDRYLAAIDGLAWGDRPTDGIVRGRRFVHPRLGIAFEAPAGFSLENSSAAVMGWSADGRGRLLFDAVEDTEADLIQLLRTSWSEALEPGSVRTEEIDGRPTAFGTSRGPEWTFRLAATRFGRATYRVILATRTGAPDGEGDFARLMASLREVPPEEAAALRAQRLALVTAGPDDTAATLSARMATDRPADRFAVINGLDRDTPIRPGARYKIVVD